MSTQFEQYISTKKTSKQKLEGIPEPENAKKSKNEEQLIKPEKKELSNPETETQIQRYLESERVKKSTELETLSSKKLTELKELLKEKENELANIDNEFTQKEALARKEIDAEFDPKINEIKIIIYALVYIFIFWIFFGFIILNFLYYQFLYKQ